MILRIIESLVGTLEKSALFMSISATAASEAAPPWPKVHFRVPFESCHWPHTLIRPPNLKMCHCSRTLVPRRYHCICTIRRATQFRRNFFLRLHFDSTRGLFPLHCHKLRNEFGIVRQRDQAATILLRVQAFAKSPVRCRSLVSETHLSLCCFLERIVHATQCECFDTVVFKMRKRLCA